MAETSPPMRSIDLFFAGLRFRQGQSPPSCCQPAMSGSAGHYAASAYLAPGARKRRPPRRPASGDSGLLMHPPTRAIRSFVPTMFRHIGLMVGQRKSLYDVRKVEGAVNGTCKACGKSRLFHRQSIDWQIVERKLQCWYCPDRTDTRVAVVPYASNDRELRARRAEMLIMNLAPAVLKDSTARA